MSDSKSNLKDELDLLLKNMNDVVGDDGKAHFDKANANMDRVRDRLKDIPDFEQIDKDLKNKSLNVINALFDFYNKFHHLDKGNKFYKHRMSLDALNFANIFYQVKTIKLAINLIMEEMYVSGTDAKLASALSSLQDRFADAIKSQANYVLFIEDQYKTMVLEGEAEAERLVEHTEPEQLPEGTQTPTEKHIADNSEYFIATSTKDVIKQIRRDEGVKPIISDNPNPLTDPDKKTELMEDLDVELEDDETYIGDHDGLLKMI